MIYKLSVDYDQRGNSPWDSLTYGGDLEALWPLYDDRVLSDDWRPLKVCVWPAEQAADVLYFDGLFAVREPARVALESILATSAELLPLRSDSSDRFYVLHPLQFANLAADARVRRNEVSRNITVVYHYSFEAAEVERKDCFRIRQPRDSAAGKHGGFSDVLVSERVRRRIEASHLTGVRLTRVFPAEGRLPKT